MNTGKPLRALGLCLALLWLLGGCQPTPHEEEAPLSIVWPYPPDEPRISYVRSIRRPDDLGIRKSFFERLRDVVFGSLDDRLVRPMAVLESGGTIYVADPGARGVHRFNLGSGKYDLVQGEDDAPLPSPVALAQGPGGEVFVADSKLGQILLVRPGSGVARPLPLAATLHQPTGLAYDIAQGRLFVVDTAAHDIKVFSRDGSLLKTLGERGTSAGKFNYPTFLWRSPQGRLIVTDSLNFRVQLLSESGQPQGMFGRHGDGAGDAALQKGVATDRQGHIYVANAVLHAIQIFDENGRFLMSFGGLGNQPGEFWLPAGIFISEDNTIYVADSYNQRVQVFRYLGGEP